MKVNNLSAMPKHLKEEAYYNDLYDLFTIQKCLRYVEYVNEMLTPCPTVFSQNLDICLFSNMLSPVLFLHRQQAGLLLEFGRCLAVLPADRG